MSNLQAEFLASKRSDYQDCIEMVLEGYTEIPCVQLAHLAPRPRFKTGWRGLRFLRGLLNV